MAFLLLLCVSSGKTGEGFYFSICGFGGMLGQGWGGLLWTKAWVLRVKSALPLTSFLSPCSPISYWKSLAPDRSDDEHDLLDGTSRPRYSHNYLSDSDTEAKQTETSA